jgi:hypothetical protein
VVPAIINKSEEKEASQLSLIENIQREDLNAIEEAEAIRNIMNEQNLTQDEVAKSLGDKAWHNRSEEEGSGRDKQNEAGQGGGPFRDL